MSGRSFTITDSIAAGAAVSTGFFANDQHLVEAQIPAGWTAAVMSFDTSLDGATWLPAYDVNGNELLLTAVAGGAHQVSATMFEGVLWMRLRSGTHVAPVNQVAAASLTVRLRRYD